MSGFTKLFSSILWSTVWREDLATKVCWITLLAMADQDGVAEGSLPGLAHSAGVTLDQAGAAITKFLSPDPYSRSSENDGRRIEVVDGGWRLLNHARYRYKLSAEDRKERERIKKQRYRDGLKRRAMSSGAPDCPSMSYQAEEDADADAQSKTLCAKPSQAFALEVDATQPAVCVLTLNNKNQYPILKSDVERWTRLYPAVDIEQQLRNMVGWLDANPTKRKTRGGIKKFINGWLAREQDRPSVGRGGTNGGKKEGKLGRVFREYAEANGELASGRGPSEDLIE